MSEVSDVLIKRTQNSLGKIIKKPVLTEKLLRKPPFKFLHDVIHAVIKTTGFLDGLYTEQELQSDNIKDRDEKIAFLQKTIDVIKLVTKTDVKARPSKIVAGLEADKTNELLVAIAKAIDRKIDTTNAVATVKSGNVVAATTAVASKKDAKSTSNETRKIKKETKDKKDSNTTKKVKSMTDGASKKPENEKLSRQISKESTDSTKKVNKSRSEHRDKEKDKNKEKEKERKIEQEKMATLKTETEQTLAKSESVEKKIEASKQIDKNEEMKPTITNVESIETNVKQNGLQTDELENQNKMEENVIEKREKTPNIMPEKMAKEEKHVEKPIPKFVTSTELIETEESVINDPLLAMPSTSSSSTVVPDKMEKLEKTEKISNDKPRSSKSKKSHPKLENEKNSEIASVKPEKLENFTSSKSVDKLIERSVTKANEGDKKQQKPPRTALRSAAIRPISARPSAPRLRDRNVRQIIHTESFMKETADQKADKKNAMPEFDDADNIVITDTIIDNVTTLDEPIQNDTEGEIDGKQGHLVQQILETQTAILKSETKTDVSINDESILSDRKSITRNMTELRKMIQKLSLYITPLGKMMEYFQEDVDAMQIELLMWQKAGTAAEADIKEEQRTTEKLLESFKYNLAEINNSIKDHAEQINNTTMNIIQNEEKIAKLISTL